MDTTGWKTPDPLPFSAWREFKPAEAAAEVGSRLAQLPPRLRKAAIAWLPDERELAAAFAAAPPGPLHGIPWFAKDLFDVAGAPTAAGSTFLAGIRPVAGDSAIVTRLRGLGAVLAGKSHLVEFASGLTGENPHYGDCPHPLLPDRLTGGSSSGSAALVAGGVVPLAVGTDTGGSIRVPAAFCGLYGFRLTPGDALIQDAFPLSPTMDTAGWFAANADDMRTAWRALCGRTPLRGEPRGRHLPGRALLPGMDPMLDATCSRAASAFSARLEDSVEQSLTAEWRDAVEAYLTIGMSDAHAVHRNWLGPYREHYDPVIWQRFSDAGRLPLEAVAAARSRLVAVRRSWENYFRDHDFLVLPSAPFPALRKHECTAEARRAILTLTAPASLGGFPCLCLPVNLGDGLTAGLQVVLPRADSPAVEWILGKCA